MTRREIRENVFKMLFRIDFWGQDDRKEQLDIFKWEMEHNTETAEPLDLDTKSVQEIEYIKTKCDAIIDKVGELDEIINQSATGWKTTRMAKVDLTILRLAVYEIRYEEDIPVKVSINEAVELAKKYGTDDSSSFVNGILAKVIKA